jgi:hypothetical protein
MYPSVKTLSRIFGDSAEEARAVLEGKKAPEDYPEVAQLVRGCYNRPRLYELKMAALNELGESFGVEAVFSARSCVEPEFTYLNAGDAYAETLVRYRSGTYRVTSWGDVVEAMERRGVKFD